MNSQYDFAFEELRAEISQYSPSAVQMLDQLKDGCGAQTAYYAAYVIICVKAHQELPTPKPLDSITSSDLKDFTFFEVAKDNQAALELFDQALVSYRADHERKPH